MFYVVWITLAIAFYVGTSLLSKRINDRPQETLWFWLLVGTQVFGLWPWIAKHSKNLFFDGLLYDLIIMMSFYGTFLVLGVGKGFSVIQWIALGVVLVGLFVLKFGG